MSYDASLSLVPPPSLPHFLLPRSRRQPPPSTLGDDPLAQRTPPTNLPYPSPSPVKHWCCVVGADTGSPGAPTFCTFSDALTAYLVALTNAEVTEMTRLRLENNRMGTELVDLQAQVTRSETALADLTHVENAEVTELKTALADLRAQVARLETGLTAESTKNKRICSAVAEVLERPT
ncbi:hypothetical protein B0H10DRAFT_2231168 [Mycena sp. CBHHK59/15]|nr:hypothetical protein B0H10DRAFT_2231168 [Mycena sp. CBHHK59/15]